MTISEETNRFLTLAAAALALAVSLFTLWWTSLRPGNITATFASVGVKRFQGAARVAIPLTITNDGARSVSILSAKMLESLGNDSTLYVAALEAPPQKASEAQFGALLPKEIVSQFVPVTLPPNGEVQKVLIFLPVTDGGLRAKSSQTVAYTIVFRTTVGDVRVLKSVRWPSQTDGFLANDSGASAPTTEVADWQQQSP